MQDDGFPPKAPLPVRYGTRTLAVIASLVAWLAYDGLVFAAAATNAVDSETRISHGAAEFFGAAAAAPLALLALVFAVRARRGDPIPTSIYPRTIVAVQAVGVLGLGVSLVVPFFVLWPYFNPRYNIEIDNQAPYAYVIEVHSSSTQCDDTEISEAMTRTIIHISFHNWLGCDGRKATEIVFLTPIGRWGCSWDDAKSNEPIVVTERGPNCANGSYTPGLLSGTPTTEGPLFSPPSQ